MAKEDLIAGKNKKPGSIRTTSVLSGPARALAQLHRDTMASSFEWAIREVSTLADKVQLIQAGEWGMPRFDDEFGLLLDPGWEGLDYEPSRLVMNSVDLVSDFFEIGSAADISDPINLETAIRLWGHESVHKKARQFSFDGWPKGKLHSDD